MHTTFIAALCGLAAAAQAQTAQLQATVPPGPYSAGQTLEGVVRLTWAHPLGVGMNSVFFRLRMDGFGVGDVVNPNNSNGGLNGETSADRVGIPAAELPPGGATIGDRWTAGRRPNRAYFIDATDPLSLSSGGGFRVAAGLGTGPTHLHYSVEQQAGVTFLTARDGTGAEPGVEAGQDAPAYQADPLFFEAAASFDLFKFRVRIPLSPPHTLVITPEATLANVFTTSMASSVP